MTKASDVCAVYLATASVRCFDKSPLIWLLLSFCSISNGSSSLPRTLPDSEMTAYKYSYQKVLNFYPTCFQTPIY